MDALRIQQHTPYQTLCPALPLPEVDANVTAPKFHMLLNQWNKVASILAKKTEMAAIWLPAFVAASVPDEMRDRVRLTLPRFCADEDLIRNALKAAKAAGYEYGEFCEQIIEKSMDARYR